MKLQRWIPIIGILFLIGGFIALAIDGYYNFGTCSPLPEGETCDNLTGITTLAISIMMIFLGIGLIIVAMKKGMFQLKRN
ncbi:MAG: hypothetical protein KGL95_06080 [Patescibacteria group bacterium]|nr:hypothetical protein [Patescibacteria group bacterium]